MKLLLAFLLALLIPVSAMAGSSNYQDNCRTWLALVDAGKYDESWDLSSAYFQSKVTKEQWYYLAKMARDAVGPVVKRGSAQVTPTDTLPDTPFGHYLVIVIHTKFAMNDHATETIIMKLENSEWKVAGYFVK
jgi:hypothetical protein